MAEQIIVFKNGERVITTLQEVYEGEGDDKRGVCLLMTHPYILDLIEVSDKPEEMNLQVKFSKWCPYSVDYQFRVPYDAVLAIGEPDQGLLTAYKSKVESMISTDDGRVPSADEVLAATAAGYENTPNWQQQQQAVAQAMADAATPPAVNPEVV
jgi:hypothetical protein